MSEHLKDLQHRPYLELSAPFANVIYLEHGVAGMQAQVAGVRITNQNLSRIDINMFALEVGLGEPCDAAMHAKIPANVVKAFSGYLQSPHGKQTMAEIMQHYGRGEALKIDWSNTQNLQDFMHSDDQQAWLSAYFDDVSEIVKDTPLANHDATAPKANLEAPSEASSLWKKIEFLENLLAQSQTLAEQEYQPSI
jgi:hypothetical protein